MRDDNASDFIAAKYNLERHGFSRFMFCTSEGWKDIVDKALEQMFTRDPNVKILQIKEKFGGLRIYFASEKLDELRPIVREAEELSYKTCEYCGQRGSLRTKEITWIRTLCDDHYKQTLEKYKKYREEFDAKHK